MDQTSYLNTRRCLFYLFYRSFLTHVKPSFGEKVARCKVACAWFSCKLRIHLLLKRLGRFDLFLICCSPAIQMLVIVDSLVTWNLVFVLIVSESQGVKYERGHNRASVK